MKIDSTNTKRALTNFIEKNRENFSIQLKRKYKTLYSRINKSIDGKTFVEKIYVLIFGDFQKSCVVCGNDCQFDGYYKGYRKTCSRKCHGGNRSTKAKETRKCAICGKEFEVYKKRQKSCCSVDCFSKYILREETRKKRLLSNIKYNQENYGVDYIPQTKGFSEKVKSTKLRKYGNPSFVNSEKAKLTCLSKYGVDSPTKTDVVKSKMRETCLKKYGVDNFSKTKTFKRAHFDKLIARLHTDSKFKMLFTFSDYHGVCGYYYDFKCNRCNAEFEYNINNGKYPLCPNCDCNENTFENEIEKFLLSFYTGKIIRKTRQVIKPKELDFYFPDNNVAIEFNGNYWHSEFTGGKDKKYHLNKTESCMQSGIQLIHIFEDEWILKKEIIQSKIKSILGYQGDRIYARNCEIREISSVLKNKFLSDTHIQGEDRSKIKLGLFHSNELVAVMTFGYPRIALGQKSRLQNEFELIRFSTSKHVIGGAGKLFSYFVRKYNPQRIISYADRRFSNGNLYVKLGFRQEAITPPNYWYFHLNSKINKRHHRFGFRKQELSKKLTNFNPTLTEWENMQLHGYDRIWDCGNLKFVWE